MTETLIVNVVSIWQELTYIAVSNTSAQSRTWNQELSRYGSRQ